MIYFPLTLAAILKHLLICFLTRFSFIPYFWGALGHSPVFLFYLLFGQVKFPVKMARHNDCTYSQAPSLFSMAHVVYVGMRTDLSDLTQGVIYI